MQPSTFAFVSEQHVPIHVMEMNHCRNACTYGTRLSVPVSPTNGDRHNFFSLFYLFACAELLHFRLDDCNTAKVVKWKSIEKSRSSRFRAGAAGICGFFCLLRRRNDRRLSFIYFLFVISFFFEVSKSRVVDCVDQFIVCSTKCKYSTIFVVFEHTMLIYSCYVFCWIFNFTLNLCIGLVIMRWRRAIIYAIHCPSHYRD